MVERNTKAGSQLVEPAFTATFYFDACFWKLPIPVVFGRTRIDAIELVQMPDTLKAALRKDSDACVEFRKFFRDVFDYACGIEALVDEVNGFSQEVLLSANPYLNATVSELHEGPPNSASSQSARMAAEMFLKGYAASKGMIGKQEAFQKALFLSWRQSDQCWQSTPRLVSGMKGLRIQGESSGVSTELHSGSARKLYD